MPKLFAVESYFLMLGLLFGLIYPPLAMGESRGMVISPFKGFNFLNLSPDMISQNVNIVQMDWKKGGDCRGFIDKKVVVKRLEDYIAYRLTCPIEGAVLVLNSSMDFNPSTLQNIRNTKDSFLVSSSSIDKVLNLALRAFDRVAVLQASKTPLNPDTTNKKDVLFYEVNTPDELIHAFGKMARRYDAVIIDGQGMAFTDSSMKIIRSISFKYKLPIIGGLSEDYLFQGAVAGIYNSNKSLMDCLVKWSRDKQCHINKSGEVLFNDSLLKYFGLSRESFGVANDKK